MTEAPQVPTRQGVADRPSARAVAQVLRSLASRLQLYSDGVGHDLGLHRSDLMAMNLMSQSAQRGKLMTPTDVSKKMSLSPAAVTALVDRLERVGHLVRHPDPDDRRRVRLDVSKQAEMVSRQMFRPLNAGLNEAMLAYTDEELELVQRVLTDLSEAVVKVVPSDNVVKDEHSEGVVKDEHSEGVAKDEPSVARQDGQGPTLVDHETG